MTFILPQLHKLIYLSLFVNSFQVLRAIQRDHFAHELGSRWFYPVPAVSGDPHLPHHWGRIQHWTRYRWELYTELWANTFLHVNVHLQKRHFQSRVANLGIDKSHVTASGNQNWDAWNTYIRERLRIIFLSSNNTLASSSVSTSDRHLKRKYSWYWNLFNKI